MLKFLIMVLASSLCLVSCSSKKNEPQGGLVHGGGKPQTPRSVASGGPSDEMVTALKGGTLGGYATSTIGAAFDAYKHLDKVQWKQSAAPGDKTYVDYTGWFKDNNGVEVKFVIYDDGQYGVAMISKLQKQGDGRIVAAPVSDQKRVLDAIYANKEFTL